jgi:hypothetical protein
MIHAAIVARKDVKGSSIKAITKYLQTNYEHVLQVSTKSFKTLLNKALKQGVLERRFLKLKGSYKISMEWKKMEYLKCKTKLQGKKAKEREKKRKKENVTKSSHYGHTLNTNYLHLDIENVFYKILFQLLKQYYPMFSMKARKVDKLKFKHSRGKSGKYMVE